MSCGAAIPADAENCAQCGADFARKLEPPPPSDDDPRTVAIHEVSTADEPAPFVSAHGTVPLESADLAIAAQRPPAASEPPEPEPDSMDDDPGTVMMRHEPEEEDDAEEDQGPDSGTMVMGDILAEQAAARAQDAATPDEPTADTHPRRPRVDPYAKTAIGKEPSPIISSPTPVMMPQPGESPPAQEASAPQHYSVPPAAAAERLPATGEFSSPGVLPDIPAPPDSLPRPPAARDPQPSAAAAGEAAMSMVAGTAKIVSDAFNSGFGNALPGWRTEVAAPMGMSTEGGKQALMPITLVNAASQRIAIGHADAAHRVVILRTHDAVARAYAKRYHRGWDVNPEQYAALLETISSFFIAMQFDFETEQRVESSPPIHAMDADEQRRNMVILASVFVACVLAIIIVAATRG